MSMRAIITIAFWKLLFMIDHRVADVKQCNIFCKGIAYVPILTLLHVLCYDVTRRCMICVVIIVMVTW